MTNQAPRGRAGFTLIELLVVVGVIGVLVALLIPAVQAAREGARRAQCVSNLRQVGLALNLYLADHAVFPPGELVAPYGPNPGFKVNYTSPFVRLLPYIEQRNLYASINFNLHAFDNPQGPIVENSTARTTVLAVLLCPSDGEPNHMNSYRFNTGRMESGNLSQGADGPFSLGMLPSPSTITDGLSRTAFLSERVGGGFQKNHPNPAVDMKLPVIPIAAGKPWVDSIVIESCEVNPAKGWITDEGRYWYYWGAAYTAYNHNGSPNDPRPTCGGEVGGLLPPRSRHSGVVNVLLGDGHVEAVANSINQQVWYSLGSANSGD